MVPTVIKPSKFMVRPAASTPTGILDLSSIDRLPGLNCKVRTFHVFANGVNPADVIRRALSKALVHFYPMAGRLVRSSQGELQIDCTGEGVWLVEAAADCRLEDVNYLSHPLVPFYNDLLPDPPTDTDPHSILVLMQVTQFKCGGFAIGLELCHSVCDGLGAAKFLNCVGEHARGFDKPSVEPIWLREAVPAPPKPTYGPPAEGITPTPLPVADYKLEQATIDMTTDHIASFKRKFYEQTGRHCSTFEILAANLWQRRTRAVRVDPDVDVKLVFFANARPLVQPELPEGFYGNCFFPVSATVRSGELVGATDVEVVCMIKEAKARLGKEFEDWAAGVGEDPYLPELKYTTLFVSEWSRLGFGQVDYGWGSPLQVVPLTYSDIIPVCIISSQLPPAKGFRLITQCVEAAHLPALLEQMKSVA